MFFPVLICSSLPLCCLFIAFGWDLTCHCILQMVAQTKLERRRRIQAELEQKQAVNEKENTNDDTEEEEVGANPENIHPPSEPMSKTQPAGNRTAGHAVPAEDRTRDERKESQAQADGKVELRPAAMTQKGKSMEIYYCFKDGETQDMLCVYY